MNAQLTSAACAASALSARALTKRYGQRVALAALDLELPPGQSVVLLGPNGAGKSTLLRLCAGVMSLSGGELRVHGALPTTPRARVQIGFVPQSIALYPRLSVRENLAFFAELHGVPRALRAERVDHGLAIAGLESRATERVAALSGGMQRRLNFACAVLHQPRLLLLDEPMVGVDLESRELLYRAMDAQRAAGVTLVCSTHELEETARLDARVVLMRAGRVVADPHGAALRVRHDPDALRRELYALAGARTVR